VGKGINTAISSYNDAVGSMDRSVLPAARKFKKLHSINENAPLPDVPALESAPRQIISLADMEESVDFDADKDDKLGHG
jgi:DNA recombination protein RmuC